ncbi:hypothetical protein N1031_17110 [Herbiconiux moechotypicola]|uniref:Htaa domain-containing protein n=1 Tax=Herbiconiux moechotypicola TaxID=637393 RepID=A0ABN3DQY4_9MICO|nr:hypothetical protein [Herbiconiux moechotypicola]MCS5731483.1 hypothetical protein [Herbiconiux moechotypicola]
MTTISEPDADPEPGDDLPGDQFDLTAGWMAGVVARVSDQLRAPLPGIVSPLAFSADFAVNSQSDVVSLTLGNGRVRLVNTAAEGASGALHLSLSWSAGFHAHGLAPSVVEDGQWVVDSVGESGAELSRAALTTDARETVVPTVTIVKTEGAGVGDEFVARLWGEAPDCRGAVLRGWSRV